MIKFSAKTTIIIAFLFSVLIIITNGYLKNNDKNKVVTIQTKNIIPADYQLLVEEKTIRDEMSPMGYWEISLSYPKITEGFPENIKAKVNNAIKDHVGKYGCSDLGDHAFVSETKYFDKELLSMAYETIWMCSTMPAPDSASGALTFNLLTGEPLLLSDEFIDNKAGIEFFSMLAEKIKSQTLVRQAKNEIDCPEITTHSYFYKTKGAITLVAEAPFHSDSECTIEIEFGSSEMKRFLKSDSLLLK